MSWLLVLALTVAVAALAWGFTQRDARQSAQDALSKARALNDTLTRQARAASRAADSLLDELPLGIVWHGADTGVLRCNRAAVDLLGVTEDQLRGRTCHDPAWNLVTENGSTVPGANHPVARAAATRQPQKGVLLGFERPGSWDRTWVLVGALPEVAADGSLTRVVCTLLDVSARKQLENDARIQSVRDPLTGCFNRRYLDDFEQRARGPAAQWGCLTVDLIGLKACNETYGHQEGDARLVKMGRFLTLQVRAGEAVVRKGGDEFLVILTAVDDEGVAQVVRRLTAEAERSAPMSFRLGWAARSDDESLDRTIARAEANVQPVEVPERELPVRRAAGAEAPA